MPSGPLVLLGPTASGKTAVSLPLARMLDAEIISVDSRQIFTGMAVGSAAPTALERGRIPHHLVEAVDPVGGMSAGEFGRRAREAMADIRARGRRPLLVGGSGLYLRAALGGLSERLPRSDAVREALRERLGREGSESLHWELASLDPETAARISPRDGQRLTRALEILRVGGEKPSVLRTQGREAERGARVAVLDRTPEDLDARIARRVEAMTVSGLENEVKALLDRGIDPASPVMRSVGYAETLRRLRGELDREQWIDAIRRNTRRYAKRQRTWFRGLPEAVWVPVPAGEDPEATAARIARLWEHEELPPA